MVLVNDKLVRVLQSLMLVRVAVRFRPLPAFVLVLVVLVMDMKMGVIHRLVGVPDAGGVRRRP